MLDLILKAQFIREKISWAFSKLKTFTLWKTLRKGKKLQRENIWKHDKEFLSKEFLKLNSNKTYNMIKNGQNIWTHTSQRMSLDCK